MTYIPARPPRAKQQEALARLEGQEAFALLMAMRTGKSQVVLDDFGRLEEAGEASDLLVIAPAGSYRTWRDEAARVLGGNLRERIRSHVWETAGGRGHDRELAALLAGPGPRMLMVNVEALSKTDRARQAVASFLRSSRAAVTAVDESTAIKAKSQRTKFVLSLAPLSRHRRILSGLVAPKDFQDLFYQFYFLNPAILGHRSFFSYRARYAVMKRVYAPGQRIVYVPASRDEMSEPERAAFDRGMEEIRTRIAPYSFRVRLEDCYDLPESTYQFRHVSLTDEQRKAYEEIRNYATTKLASEAHVTANLVITQMIRLHQIVLGHVREDESGNIHLLPERRTAELLSLLEDYEGKAIIWVAYNVDVTRVSQALTKTYGNASVAHFWGGNATTREADDRRFREDPACRFMIATAGAGGRGRTWDVADLVIYHSSTDNLEHRDQSEERAKNVDKARSVLYVDLVVPGTVEERIIKHLREKIDLASVINGDDYREWLI